LSGWEKIGFFGPGILKGRKAKGKKGITKGKRKLILKKKIGT
jgi:hypothetical protein